MTAPPSQTVDRSPAGAPIELRWQILLPWTALATILLTATMTDPDLWGHLRFGLDWMHARTWPSVDPYSFTQDRPWINHEWLSEALAAVAFAAAGVPGLVIMKAAVMSATFGLLWRRLQQSTPVFKIVVTTIAMIGALPLSVTVRPQLWSMLGLMVLVEFLSEKPPTAGRIGGAAALFAAWANMHGGWITGGGVLALHVVIRSIRAPRDALRWLVLGVASLAATLVNPYGIGLWRFLAATVRMSRPDISEWSPFGLTDPAIMWFSVVAPLALLALLYRRREHPSLEAVTAVLLMVAAGVKVSRVAPLVCPACIAVLAPWLASAWGSRGRVVVSSAAAGLIFFLPGAFAFAAAYRPVTTVMHCIPLNYSWAADREAAATLKGRRGRLWTTFNWGEYAIWHFGPDLKVSIDGRRETVYSDAVIAWSREVEAGEPSAIQRLLDLAPE